jgi:hypothetical protein
MAHFSGLESRIPTFEWISGSYATARKSMLNHMLLRSLLVAQLDMDKKVGRRIFDNMYQTLQEHQAASRELEKIQFSKKNHTFFEEIQSSQKSQTAFSKHISQ